MHASLPFWTSARAHNSFTSRSRPDARPCYVQSELRVERRRARRVVASCEKRMGIGADRKPLTGPNQRSGEDRSLSRPSGRTKRGRRSIARPSTLNRTVTQLLRNDFIVIPVSHCCTPLAQRSARLCCHQRMTAMIFDKRKVSPLDIDFIAGRSRFTCLRRSPNAAPRPIHRPQS